MKKVIFLVVAIIIFSVTNKAWAQAIVTNSTSKVVTFKSNDGNGEVTIRAYEKGRISFAPSYGAFAFDLYVYEGSSENYVASFVREIKKGQYTLTVKDLTGENPIETVEKPKVVEQPIKETPSPVVSNYSNVRTTKVALKNSSDFRIFALDGVLAGLALAPGQSATDSVVVPTGQFEVTFKHDIQQESSTNTTPTTINTRNTRNDAKVAHGRSYRQSVYSGIVVQGQKELEIKNENLTFIEGRTIRTMARSYIPYKFVFTAGPWKGQALNNNEYTRKDELSEGFNSFSIQYVGPDGLKYQADIEVIVTSRDRPLVFKESDIKNKMRIKQ